jgi:hypothetical protein
VDKEAGHGVTDLRVPPVGAISRSRAVLERRRRWARMGTVGLGKVSSLFLFIFCFISFSNSNFNSNSNTI